MMMAGVVGGLEAFEGSLAKYELSRTGRVRPVVPPGRRRGGARKGLLTAEEEVAIGRKIQELMPLEIAREELCAECGAAISWEEAANRLGLAPAEMLDGMRTLRQMKGVMVEKNMGLVYTMARRYRNFGVSYDDLVQEGALGLMRAAEKFNPELGFRFSTYAVWWIRQRQQTAATKHQMISISTTQRFKYSKILEKIKKYENEYGREPTAAELPGVTGFDAQTIEDLKISTSLRFESFSKKIKFNSAKSDDAFELQDTISCDEALPEDAADALYRRQGKIAFELVKNVPLNEKCRT